LILSLSSFLFPISSWAKKERKRCDIPQFRQYPRNIFICIAIFTNMRKRKRKNYIWEGWVSTSCVGCTCFRRPWENVPGVKCVVDSVLRAPRFVPFFFLLFYLTLYLLLLPWPCNFFIT
jgi:hypothetical protein